MSQIILADEGVTLKKGRSSRNFAEVKNVISKLSWGKN